MLNNPNDIIPIALMHKMQSIENLMSPKPRGFHMKSDNKGMDISNINRMRKNSVWMLNLSRTSSRLRKERNQIRQNEMKWNNEIKIKENTKKEWWVMVNLHRSMRSSHIRNEWNAGYSTDLETLKKGRSSLTKKRMRCVRVYAWWR